jgi:hypothetical protein
VYLPAALLAAEARWWHLGTKAKGSMHHARLNCCTGLFEPQDLDFSALAAAASQPTSSAGQSSEMVVATATELGAFTCELVRLIGAVAAQAAVLGGGGSADDAPWDEIIADAVAEASRHEMTLEQLMRVDAAVRGAIIRGW